MGCSIPTVFSAGDFSVHHLLEKTCARVQTPTASLAAWGLPDGRFVWPVRAVQ